jgi:hypothetical protein
MQPKKAGGHRFCPINRAYRQWSLTLGYEGFLSRGQRQVVSISSR